MTETIISFVDTVPAHVISRRSEDLAEYERRHGVHLNYRKFAFLLSALGDGDNTTIGVLDGYTAYAEVYIDDLWVDSSHRNKGYGTLLIEALENAFRGRGFNNINLVTSEFQAPDFYRKCGFVEEFTRTNTHNPNLTKTFFAKFFEEANQTQGVVVTCPDT